MSFKNYKSTYLKNKINKNVSQNKKINYKNNYGKNNPLMKLDININNSTTKLALKFIFIIAISIIIRLIKYNKLFFLNENRRNIKYCKNYGYLFMIIFFLLETNKISKYRRLYSIFSCFSIFA